MANKKLDEFAQVIEREKKIKEERSSLIETIRSGFEKTAVVFIDVVGSTKFKLDHKQQPEVWI